MEANQTRQIFAVASAFFAVLSHNRVLSPVFPLGIGIAVTVAVLGVKVPTLFCDNVVSK